MTFNVTAAHFVNWPPQPAKSHAVIDADGNNYLPGDGVNASRSGTNIGSHGGNNDLASILVRLSQSEQNHLVRLAVVNLIERRRPMHGGNALTASQPNSFPDPLFLPSSMRVLHGGRHQQQQQQTKRNKRKASDQDEMIWEMLRDWIAQEQRMMAADQPPSEQPSENKQVDDDEAFESSGDDKEAAFVEIKAKSSSGASRVVLLTEPDRETDEADLVVERDDDLVPASMAIAESLILLAPASPSPAPAGQTQQPELKQKMTVHPEEKSPAQGQPKQENEEGLKLTTTTRAPLRLSITARTDPSVNQTGSDHLLLVHDSSRQFAYDDHVIEIVQLDPFASVTPRPPAPPPVPLPPPPPPSPLLHQTASPATAAPSMNKTTSNPAVDVIADISSHLSSGLGQGSVAGAGQTWTHQGVLLLSTTDQPVTIQQPNDWVASSNGRSDAEMPDDGLVEAHAPPTETVHSLDILPRLDANHSRPDFNVTNETLPPDEIKLETPSGNINWPVIVSLVEPPLDSLLDPISLAGNISAEPIWRDVVSYRGNVQSLPPVDGCDCQCPCSTETTPTDLPTTIEPVVVSTTTYPETLPVTFPFSCPPLDITTSSTVSSTTTTTTTTTSPTTTAMPTTESTTTTPPTSTTTQMIPPILILEGEGRRIC